MPHAVDSEADLLGWLRDERLQTFRSCRPGFGGGCEGTEFRPLRFDSVYLVLDADGISSFRDDPTGVVLSLRRRGPAYPDAARRGFHRLFPDIADDETMGKVDKAQAAARRANAAIIYKGADTVIASPDGRALINTNAPISASTAGSGDVLAGIVRALLAQGIPAFEAAAAVCLPAWRSGNARRQGSDGGRPRIVRSTALTKASRRFPPARRSRRTVR